MIQIHVYWYESNQSRYRYHYAQSCMIYVFRVFDKIFTLSQIFSGRVLFFLCPFFMTDGVRGKLRKSVSDYKNARSSVSPNILRAGSWPTVPVYRIRCFILS